MTQAKEGEGCWSEVPNVMIFNMDTEHEAIVKLIWRLKSHYNNLSRNEVEFEKMIRVPPNIIWVIKIQGREA